MHQYMLHCFFVLFFAFCFQIKAQEQVVESGFEKWSGSPAHPNGWVTQQSVSGLKGNLESQDMNIFHSGSSSMRLATDTITIPLAGNLLINGFALYGTATYQPPTTVNYRGTPFTHRPDSIVFWYRFSPVENDSANFGIQLTKWRDSTTYIAVNADYEPAYLLNTNGSWIRNSCPLTYFSEQNPDTILIAFGSGSDVKHRGSLLWVDDVSLIYNSNVGVLEDNTLSLQVDLFPNPTSATLYFSKETIYSDCSVDVYDMKGKRIIHDTLKNNSLDVSNLENGTYYIQLLDNKGKQHQGSFVITR